VDVLPGGLTLRGTAVQGQSAFQRTDVGGLQALTDGSGIVVAVVDSGADYGHPDAGLTDRLLAGWDFANGDADAQDDQGHGTRIAGILAAILSGVEILPVKVLGSQATGTVFDVAEGIEWAADQGADVVNLSLGGPEDSQTLRQAVAYAQSLGAVVVASAGNRDSGQPQYPAAIPSVIAVAGLDGSDVRADFLAAGDAWASSYGSHVDVSAPAIDVKTTSWPDDFVQADGTSYAAAIVSAIVAGQKAVGKTNAEAEADLESTAVDVDALNPGYAGLLGSGRVAAGAAVR
jgi:thermitase